MKRQPSEGKKRGGGTPCCTKAGLKRGPWTPEEDELLASYVKREGAGKWRTLPKRAGLLRCGKSCRLRWMNYLRPTVKRGQIGLDEEDLILRLHRLLGNRWSLIAGRIPGRTDNEIKNYWNTHISKKLVSQGIDPRTHRPLSTSNQYNTPSTTTTININDNALLTTPNHTPNPSPFEAHETNLIATKEIVHANNQLDHMLFHGSVTDYYLDGDGSNEGLGVDCFPDDMFSSYINSFVDEDILQQKKEVNDNIINNNYGCGGNGCNNGGDDNVMAPTEPLASPLSAFGDENFWENVVSSAEDADQFMDFSDHFNKFS